jgi:hypothetical protein
VADARPIGPVRRGGHGPTRHGRKERVMATSVSFFPTSDSQLLAWLVNYSAKITAGLATT